MGIANKLLREGYEVLLSGTQPESRKDEILAPLIEEGYQDRCEYFKCDISLGEDRDALFAHVASRYGRLDVLVNNAGVAPLVREDLLKMVPESLDRLIGINLKGTFFMCQQGANLMLKLGASGGLPQRIINISSISAYTTSTNRGEYCISKAGVSMVTQLFADRLASEGILMFEVRPGIILTDMTEIVKDKYEKLIEGGLTPIARMGQPSDVAGMVYAACSGLLDFTTGQVLNADGGFHLRRL
ncbi:MAG: 3-ketoacyl-ACP reductase [Clostridiales bacterium]|nr:3-ketoacyl-ACP reductase [Clostridiales bacterium]